VNVWQRPTSSWSVFIAYPVVCIECSCHDPIFSPQLSQLAEKGSRSLQQQQQQLLAPRDVEKTACFNERWRIISDIDNRE